jgi:hypothetical protein
MAAINKLLGVVCCVVVLSGCNYRLVKIDSSEMRTQDIKESMNTPTPAAPSQSDYVSNRTSEEYHIGMLRYRQSLIEYQRRLSEYIDRITLAEGFRDQFGKPCTFPYSWEPIELPDSPAPVTRDPELVNQLLSGHVRDIRRIIAGVNREYAPCVK